jgi:uncharacterized protein YuzB (UPF0349 family)
VALKTIFYLLDAILFPVLVIALLFPPTAPGKSSQPVPVTVTATPLNPPAQACNGTFVSHTLNHTTTVPGGDTVRMFEANGAGLAINDLDNDGDLDLVLANHRDANTILWNEGALRFRTERLPFGNSRAATVVDVDSDGWQDIVFSRVGGGLTFWRNRGGENFEQQVLPGIAKPAYALNWADLNADGDLDLVTGSYDAGLLTELGNDFLLGGGAGVYVYTNQQGRFSGQQLATEAQAMAIDLLDLNRDGRPDIVVGNDFDVPDRVWLQQDGGWIDASPFPATSHSTMSIAHADINNDGLFEIFATDMLPVNHSPETMAAWQPLLADMGHEPMPNDPQLMQNALQLPKNFGRFIEAAAEWGVSSTGWSWSSKFGDLNNDGFADLYVVNGMIEQEMFGHLPNHELVEKNQALSNSGRNHFRPVPEWNLGSTASGRGMSMADLDSDGDLDIVVNNLRAPAQLFENRLCGGESVEIDLFWPGSGNQRAIGAVLALHTSHNTYRRNVTAASGYLSGDPARVHFGLPRGATLESLEIFWPDGDLSTVTGLSPQTLLKISR